MESIAGDAVFDSFNLPPRLFINEVFNSVDDLLDEAFDFFLQESLKILKTEDTDRADELRKGVAYIRDMVELTLNQRLEKWEEYCLRFFFTVPKGFSLPEPNGSSGNDLPDLDVLNDTEIDAQLNSLREELVLVGKESAELGKELRALERQSLSSNQSAGIIDEALQLYEKNDTLKLFKELTNMASEFHAKLGNLKRRRMEETESERCNRLCVRYDDMLRTRRGLLGSKLEDLQKFVDEVTGPS